MTEIVGQIAYEVSLETGEMIRGQRRVQAELDKTKGGLDDFGAKATKVAAAVSLALSAITVASVVTKLVDVQRQFDVLFSSLQTVTGGVAQASYEWDRLVKFAAKTPYTLDQSVGAFVKLKALGLDPSERAMTSFGNTAAAMGKDLMQMIEAVADASTGEFERLKEFGIKAKVQGDQVSLTFQGVTTTIKNSADKITEYLTKIGENQFAGAMQRRVETLDGAISNLGDSWNTLFLTVSQSGVGDAIAAAANKGSIALERLSRLVKDMESRGFAAAVLGYDDLAKAAIRLNEAKSQLDTKSGKGVSGFIFTTSADSVRQKQEVDAAQREFNEAKAEFKRIEREREKQRLLSTNTPSGYTKPGDGGGQADKARALADFEKQGEKFTEKRARMEQDIAKARELGLQAGLSELRIDERVAAIRKSYAGEPSKPKADKFDDDAYLSGLRRAQASEINVINETENEKLRVAKKNLDERKINEKTYAEAVSLITKTAEEDRLTLMRNTQEEIDKDRKQAEAKAVEDRKQHAADIQKAMEYGAQLTKAVNPIDALRQEYEAKLALVTQYEEMMAMAGVDATTQGQMARTQITNEYELQRQALAEQSFRSQSEANAFLIDSLNALSSSATSSIMGLIDGTMTAQDAMRNLAGVVLNEAVGALVQIGVQQIKNALISDTIAAADMARKAANGAVYTATVSAQVEGMASMAAMNAFAATAAIPIIGPGLAPAAAAAAAAAATALGSPAIATAPIAGARQYGGPVSAGSLYRVNETGQPEMFTAGNGSQYMMPTKSGSVTPANQVGAGGGGWTVIINNNGAPMDAQVQSVDQQAKTVTMAVTEVARQISTNSGPTWAAMRGATNVQGRVA